MNVMSSIIKRMPDVLRARWGVNEGIQRFAFDPKSSVKADIQAKHGSSDLLDIYASNQGQVVHKWHHYIPIYERYFAQFRARKFRFLEIGVSKGGSLNLWRRYFGPEAIIFGIDIDPACRAFNGISGQVRIGSQDDPRFLDSVIEEMGGVDVVLDDGSHQIPHVIQSLRHIFPKLNLGGIYMIEDLHTAYWNEFGGGYQTKDHFFKFVAELMDDMHHWYHVAGVKHPQIGDACPAIHIHDSITVLEKTVVHRPTHSQVG